MRARAAIKKVATTKQNSKQTGRKILDNDNVQNMRGKIWT